MILVACHMKWWLCSQECSASLTCCFPKFGASVVYTSLRLVFSSLENGHSQDQAKLRKVLHLDLVNGISFLFTFWFINDIYDSHNLISSRQIKFIFSKIFLKTFKKKSQLILTIRVTFKSMHFIFSGIQKKKKYKIDPFKWMNFFIIKFFNYWM